MLAVFVLPVFAWAGGTKKFYVDDSASGTQNGSIEHPYKTISEALKHVSGDDEIHVANGTYKENIKIPYAVKLFGEDQDKTIIDADNDSPAVSMSHKTTLDKFTIKGGEHGIYVRKGSKASIVKCTVRDADKDGIHVREANTTSKYSVNIIESDIRNSDRAGIFSEKRKIVIIDTVVRDNDSDGMDIATGSKAWIDNNTFRDNDGSGLKVSLDNSSILVASKNTFRDNGHEGVEVNAYGKTGIVNIKKSKFVGNKNYGIARIARSASVSSSVWNGLTQTDNTFSDNERGELSPVLNIR